MPCSTYSQQIQVYACLLVLRTYEIIRKYCLVGGTCTDGLYISHLSSNRPNYFVIASWSLSLVVILTFISLHTDTHILGMFFTWLSDYGFSIFLFLFYFFFFCTNISNVNFVFKCCVVLVCVV